jgi:hypothetical protein
VCRSCSQLLAAGSKEAAQERVSPGDGRPTLIAAARGPEDVPVPDEGAAVIDEVAAVIATVSEAAVGVARPTSCVPMRSSPRWLPLL